MTSYTGGLLRRTKVGDRNASDDKRLERLDDCTKFHIGLYLSAAAGLTGLISAVASGKVPE
jgi:hypothetical protein